MNETAETAATALAERNGWHVVTNYRYVDGVADISYRHGNRAVHVTFGRTGRVNDVTVVEGHRVVQLVPSKDTRKRAQLLKMLQNPPA